MLAKITVKYKEVNAFFTANYLKNFERTAI